MVVADILHTGTENVKTVKLRAKSGGQGGNVLTLRGGYGLRRNGGIFAAGDFDITERF